jgi:hypothetical protein
MRCASALFLLTGAASLASCASATPAASTIQDKPAMPTHPIASRPSAPEVPPIDHQGVRYEQDRHDDRAGDQPGGYLAATDIKTGQRLWRIQVYQVGEKGPAGAPVQARYFRAMQLAPDGASLIIENEAGGVYHVDLATRLSKQVAGPPETAVTPPAKPKPQPD